MSLIERIRKNGIVKKVYLYVRMVLTMISPTLATRFIYRVMKGKKLNLKNPKTFDEKILWLKLNTYYKNPLISKCADKYEVRQYVKSCGCGEILNELYYVFDNVDDINWESLPNSFVLKWNTGSGYNIICYDKEKLNIEDAKEKLKKWGRAKDYLKTAEIHYKYIPRKIICEKYLGTSDGILPKDYKFFCFNGKAKYVMVCVDREKGKPKLYYFDRNWNRVIVNKGDKDVPEDFTIEKPKDIDKMFLYADKLSKPFPFVRTDLYYVEGKIIFGELTFTPHAGIDPKRLPEADLMFGQMLTLPKTK